MALLTVANVQALLHRRAQKATITEVTNFLNEEIKTDIKAGLFSTFETDFIKYIEIDIDTAVATEYALPADFYIHLEVVDQKNLEVETGVLNSLDKDRNKILFSSSSVDGSPVVVVDADATFTKLIINYEVVIGDVSAADDVLPYPNHVAQKIIKILAKGVDFYFFGDKKKFADQAVADTKYNDLKAGIFNFSIMTL